MSDYEAVYERRFVDNLNRYASMRKNIKRRVDQILKNPFHNTEILCVMNSKLNLVGCRSVRIE